MRSVNITAIAPNGDVWDLKVNSASTQESLLSELIKTMELDSSQQYAFRGNPQFPLSDGAFIVIDMVAPKHILSASKRGR